jgi:hypothetical protein
VAYEPFEGLCIGGCGRLVEVATVWSGHPEGDYAVRLCRVCYVAAEAHADANGWPERVRGAFYRELVIASGNLPSRK